MAISGVNVVVDEHVVVSSGTSLSITGEALFDGVSVLVRADAQVLLGGLTGVLFSGGTSIVGDCDVVINGLVRAASPTLIGNSSSTSEAHVTIRDDASFAGAGPLTIGALANITALAGSRRAVVQGGATVSFEKVSGSRMFFSKKKQAFFNSPFILFSFGNSMRLLQFVVTTLAVFAHFFALALALALALARRLAGRA